MKHLENSYDEQGILFKIFWARKYLDRDTDAAEMRAWVCVAIVASVLFFAVYSIAMLGHHLCAPSCQAEALQVQEDLHILDVCDVETRNRVISLNTQVRSRQRYNAIWFFDPIIPDSWDELQVIKVPSTRCYKDTERKDYNLDVNVKGLEMSVGGEDKAE